MKSIFGNATLLSVLTILSRFLGLARDIMFFSAFGTSFYGEAFILAFTLPNLFRRMLGEGALSSAFIPIYTQTLQSESIKSAFSLLSKVLSRLMIFLLALSILVSCISCFLLGSPGLLSDKWSFAANLNSISFPYVALICCAAIAIGALNGHRSFFAGGFSPIILNLSMITTLAIWGFFIPSKTPSFLAFALCFSVLIAGIVQFLIPLNELKLRFHWKFRFDLHSSPKLSQINQLFWIGAFGAAVSQINVLISRFLAYSLDETGTLSYLYLSSRLIELPLGVFAISISTVLFPELARAVEAKSRTLFSDSLFKGLRMTIAITLPAAVGLGVLATPILSVLFQWGNFRQTDVDIATEILIISACTLPFYAFSAFLIKAFHSEKNMHSPLRAALISLFANLAMSLLLMGTYGVYGLAFANLIAAVSQCFFLYFTQTDLRNSLSNSLKNLRILTISSASFLMGLVIHFSMHLFSSTKIGELLSLISLIPLGAGLYLLVLWTFGFPELKSFLLKFKTNARID